LKSQSDYTLSVLAVNLAVLFWGMTPIFVKAADATSSAVLAFRMVFAVPIALVFFFKEGSKINKRLLIQAILPGFLFFLATSSGYASFQKTSIANAMLISQLAPIIVMFSAPFLFKESLEWRRVVLAIVALGGAAFVVFGGSTSESGSLIGDGLAVINCITWACYLLIVKRRRDEGVMLWAFLAPVMFWAALFSVLFGVLIRQSLSVSGLFNWTMIMSLAVISIVAHGLLTWAQQRLDAAVASLFLLAMPVVSAAAAWIVFNEVLAITQIVGGFIVISSLVAVSLLSNKNRKLIQEFPNTL
jgi:drug/metabolite transporter (DMT)-like permease